MILEITEKAKTILESVEELGHAAEYQCRKGYCGSCAVDIVSGCIAYDFKPQAFCPEGQVIICCARPSPSVFISLY